MCKPAIALFGKLVESLVSTHACASHFAYEVAREGTSITELLQCPVKGSIAAVRKAAQVEASWLWYEGCKCVVMLVKSLATHYSVDLRASIVSAVIGQPRSSHSPATCSGVPSNGCLEQESTLVVTE